jgi:hypothetical protein
MISAEPWARRYEFHGCTAGEPAASSTCPNEGLRLIQPTVAAIQYVPLLDVDFEKLELSVTRSIYRQVVGHCKTEISRKPVPLDTWIAEELLTWKRATPYN